MEEKKELDQSQLEKVAGGANAADYTVCCPKCGSTGILAMSGKIYLCGDCKHSYTLTEKGVPEPFMSPDLTSILRQKPEDQALQ